MASSDSLSERGSEDEVFDDKDGEECSQSDSSQSSKPKKGKRVHKLTLEETTDFNERLKNRGVVYISRIPPRMNPAKMKTLLEDYDVTRIFLVEEDAAVRKRRRKLTGQGFKRYSEGWIEFASKKTAKKVAASFNNTPMSNHKRSHHHDDLWNLKYLSKFAWSHLTEKVAYERRVREQKLRLETMQARREATSYKRLVETGKKLDKIAERKRKRAEKQGQQPEREATKGPVRQIQPITGTGKASRSNPILGSIV